MLASLSIPKIENVETSDKYGRFVIEPLEKGFGTTLGNALRRVLLRYLPGSAVTRVRIDGIQHEFSPIPGVKEDVLDFLLNIKSLRMKALSGKPGKLYLEKDGEGEVHASDITPSADFEIVNPDLYLATLSGKNASLAVELDVDMGMGYQTAGGSANMPIGTITVDAIFTPVRKVNFTTEPLHLGRETSQERLTVEIWTDGTMAPSRAISRGAAILVEHLKPVVDFSRASDLEEKKAMRAFIPEDIYNKPVKELDLSVRALNCLHRSGINTVGELASLDEKELLNLRNFGQKSRIEVEEKLTSLGLSFPKLGDEGGSDESEEEEEAPKKSSRKKKSS
ncbi:MAG: DNA-directed RNA polymerase subunit alpha [Dehalococcoidia bacterium]|nr:DNA-directed RNA polymerase subunit alpha [Dehalococcoidia bacterium]